MQVFQQQTDVNLLSSVLETPEFFWSAPDQLQLVYTAVCQYLEIEDRLEVLNGRFGVSCAAANQHVFTWSANSAHIQPVQATVCDFSWEDSSLLSQANLLSAAHIQHCFWGSCTWKPVSSVCMVAVSY